MKYEVIITETNKYMYYIEAANKGQAQTKAFIQYEYERENGELECCDGDIDYNIDEVD